MHHREQVLTLHGHRVDRHPAPILEALELDLVQEEPLLAVEEVGQALAEHRDAAGDRAIAGET